MKNHTILAAVLLLMILTLAACAGTTPAATPFPPAQATSTAALPALTSVPTETPPTAASETPAAATTAAPATATALPSPTANAVHGLGELVKINDLTIALIGVAYTPDQIQVIFAAKNTGEGMISPNFIEFSASAPDGTKLTWDNCFYALTKIKKEFAIPAFAGSLLPGENLRGTICWKGVALSGGAAQGAGPEPGIQVFYTPETTGKPAAAWDVSKAAKMDAPAALAASDFATPPHVQGETVAIDDVAVTFDGLTFSGVAPQKDRLVMSHFTFENKGSTSFHFGEFLSYSFNLKLADGSPLSNEFMSAGCQNTLSKVELLPGKKQSYAICSVNSSGSALAPGALASFQLMPGAGEKVIWAAK